MDLIDKKEYGIDTQQYIDKMVNYCKDHGVKIDLNNPRTIQDKLAWLNIYDINSLKTFCADKIKLHEYCKEKLGKDICIPILKTYNSVDDIDLNDLPNSFALKCNHGRRMGVIVKTKNKFDFNNTRKQLASWLNEDFALKNGFEAHYHNIERRIFAEKYIGDASDELIEYGFMCFNGNPSFIRLSYDKFGPDYHVNYYDMDFRYIKLIREDVRSSPYFHHEKPNNLELMTSYAKKLSDGFAFVNVSFYEIKGEVFLKGMAFTPNAMSFKYLKDSDDIKIGELLKLPNSIEPVVTNVMEKKKILIYTVMTGFYEIPLTGFDHKDEYDYVLICDNNFHVDAWECLSIFFKNDDGLSDAKKARYLKTHAHNLFGDKYDVVVYVDASTLIDERLYEHIEKYKDAPITFINDNSIQCVYDEIMACYYAKKETPQQLLELYDKYSRENYPKNNGLFDTNVIIMHHNDPRVIDLMDKWWGEILANSHKDKLSINYTIWKHHLSDFINVVQTSDFPQRYHYRITYTDEYKKESTSA